MINNENVAGPTRLFKSWELAVKSPESKIREVISNLDKIAIQIVLICEADGLLMGTVSDGDIRRALLSGANLDDVVSPFMNAQPLTVSENMTSFDAAQLMHQKQVRQIPIIDDEGRVIGLHLWSLSSVATTHYNVPVIIMAGGEGKRLRPYTETCPKPMLKVGSRPMLERIILNLRNEGFRDFTIAINYLGEIIENYFGDGQNHGVNITYVREKVPLGTAGALSLVDPKPGEPCLVVNGDVLTDLNFSKILAYHAEHESLATMVVREYEMQNPFGVIHIEDNRIIGFEEKPTIKSKINTGIYILSPEVFEYLEDQAHCDMPQLFERLIENKQKVVAYFLHEEWFDVGRPADLALVNQHFEEK